MATKKNRNTKRQSISSGRPRSYGEIYKADTTRQASPTAPATANRPKASAVAAVQTTDWRIEYSHVLRDLKILLIVSAVLFAVIIAAGFFI